MRNEALEIPKLDRRSKKKLEVRTRIKEAAFEVFSERGFDNATMAEIAERADIAGRTLFNYVTDKRDLLAFIMSDDFVQVTENFMPRSQWDEPIIDLISTELGKCMAVLLAHFPISQVIFQETIWNNTTGEMQRIEQGRVRILSVLKRFIEYKQSKNAITSECKAEDVAWIVFSMFVTNVRRWMISRKPSAKTDLQILRRQIWIMLNGLSPSTPEAIP